MDNDAPAPDPQVAINNAEMTKIAGRQQDLAEQAFAKQTQLADEFMPLFRQQVAQATADAATSRQRGDAQWESYTKNFAPLEAKMAETALNYDTPGRREQAAAEARGEVGQQFAQIRDAQTRDIRRTGGSLSAGRGLVMDQQNRVEAAKAAAGADMGARKAVETTSMGLVDNAARFGRNMPSTGLATAALAGQQTGQASGNVGALTTMAAAPTQTLSAGLGQATGTLGQANANYQAQYNSQLQAQQNKNGFMGDLIGAGAGLAGVFMSSKKLKRKTGDVSGKAELDQLERAPVQRWKYHGDDTEHIGRYSEDIKGGPMGGSAISVIDELGRHHAAIVELSKQNKRLRRGLRDAKRNGA